MDWYVIHTKPRQEHRAICNLERQGFECYLPTVSVEKIRRGNKCVVIEPMFTRYIFIRLDTGVYGKSWIPIRSTRGVCGMIMFGEQPAKVKSELISALRIRSEANGANTEKLFQPGEQVRVDGDAWADVEAIFEMDDGDQRAMVLINLLSRPIRVTLPLAQLRKM
ncbi:transcription/translation regulatory transformer protein RfaH [Burkholderia diffusa]|uniref:transcription/translation regulatory transformer protein RfaH n=1 Tax=Burkholderia diffusa TaxID=488732 RepID=UPI000756640B|nr:transcription/translation regulatory transformer protein RfaH [Burkholderia diffusa]KVM96721.1 hypothetical protein WJ62_22280 [Burkholderia diffusa]